MDINVKKSDDTDLANGSLAYMPKADSAEKTDEIKLDSKKEESKTMADIAEQLGKEDKATEKIPVKAAAPAVAKEPKAPKLTKDEEPEILTPQVIDGSGDDEIPPLNHSGRASGEKSGGGKGVLVALLVIALVAAGAFAYLWYSGKANADELAAKNKTLTDSNEALTQQIKTLKGDSSSGTTVTIRLIPELGVTYTLTDATKGVTYRYREITDTEKKVHKVVTFSSTDLVAAEVKVSNAAPKCTAEFGPLGTLTAYATGDTYKGAKVETQEANGTTIFKVGDTYYIYDAAQATCSADKTVQAVVTTDKTAVTDLLKSLKESK